MPDLRIGDFDHAKKLLVGLIDQLVEDIQDNDLNEVEEIYGQLVGMFAEDYVSSDSDGRAKAVSLMISVLSAALAGMGYMAAQSGAKAR